MWSYSATVCQSNDQTVSFECGYLYFCWNTDILSYYVLTKIQIYFPLYKDSAEKRLTGFRNHESLLSSADDDIEKLKFKLNVRGVLMNHLNQLRYRKFKKKMDWFDTWRRDLKKNGYVIL